MCIIFDLWFCVTRLLNGLKSTVCLQAEKRSRIYALELNDMFSHPLKIIRLKSPENTNDAVKEFISEGTCTLLVGEEPSYGKTRNGQNNWKILRGNLFMSIGIFRERVRVGETVLRVAVSVGELISKWVSKVQYKWPNDIMIDGKKVCGILLEYNSGKLVIGIGINVLHSPCPQTTCLNNYSHVDLDKLPLQIVSSLREHEDKAISEIVRIWKEKALFLGKKISFDANGEIKRGIFSNITSDGALLLEDEYSKEQKSFYSGSICIT